MSAHNKPSRKMNRRTARIVTTGLVAGGIAIAGGTAYASADSSQQLPTAAAVAAAAADPTQDYLQAFVDAGYTYDDAVVLGQQWQQEPFDAKISAGQKLIAGQALPISPGSSAPTAPADTATQEAAAVDAFYAAGYTYDDAVALAKTWNIEPYQAKIQGGQQLTAGATLPIAAGSSTAPAPAAEASDPNSPAPMTAAEVDRQIAGIKAATRKLASSVTPSPAPVTPAPPVAAPAPAATVTPAPSAAAGGIDEAAATEAFFAAGYTYDDAVALASTWKVDSYEAKVLGGQKLAAGESLPIAAKSAAPAPSDPATQESNAVDAFFAAGYTYDDAVSLGKTWNQEPYQAKVSAGQKLIAGETLPIAP